MGVEVIRAEAGTVVLDDQHMPMLVVTWLGVANVTTVTRFYAWAKVRADQAKAAGRVLAIVHDASRAQRPGPDARKAFGSGDLDGTIIVASPVVITNALVRGALTAVGWLLGEDRMRSVTSWPTLPEAFEAGAVALAKKGLKVDRRPLASYTIPESALGVERT